MKTEQQTGDAEADLWGPRRDATAAACLGRDAPALHWLREHWEYARTFVAATHDTDFLAAKAADFSGFIYKALLLMAFCLAAAVAWGYLIDPRHLAQAAGLQLFACGVVVLWAALTRARVARRPASVAALLGPLVVEAALLYAPTMINQGSAFGGGALLCLLIFLPFVLLAQPLSIAVAIAVAVAALAQLMALSVAPKALAWPSYDGAIWLGLAPMIAILALFDHCYLQLYRHRRWLAAQAWTDALTGLGNRRYLLAAAAPCLARHRRHRQSASLLFIDIDRFKAINDDHGHCTGDRALCHVAETLRGALRASDLIARYGGEEFVVLLPETDESSAERIAERMRAAVAVGYLPATVALRMTVSIGVACDRPDSGDAFRMETLIRRADCAVCEAKRRGRNRIVRHCEQPTPDEGNLPARAPRVELFANRSSADPVRSARA